MRPSRGRLVETYLFPHDRRFKLTRRRLHVDVDDSELHEPFFTAEAGNFQIVRVSGLYSGPRDPLANVNTSPSGAMAWELRTRWQVLRFLALKKCRWALEILCIDHEDCAACTPLALECRARNLIPRACPRWTWKPEPLFEVNRLLHGP